MHKVRPPYTLRARKKGGPIHSELGGMWNARRNHAPLMDVIPIDDGVARANAVGGPRPDSARNHAPPVDVIPIKRRGGVIDH